MMKPTGGALCPECLGFVHVMWSSLLFSVLLVNDVPVPVRTCILINFEMINDRANRGFSFSRMSWLCTCNVVKSSVGDFSVLLVNEVRFLFLLIKILKRFDRAANRRCCLSMLYLYILINIETIIDRGISHVQLNVVKPSACLCTSQVLV